MIDPANSVIKAVSHGAGGFSMSDVIALSLASQTLTEVVTLEQLLIYNEQLKENFRNNPLFKLMAAGHLCSKEKRDKFLNYLQVWSNHFQKAMLLKTALCDDPSFMPIFYQHFVEEYGHNELLKKERSSRVYEKDMMLEAMCNWFPSKMLSFNLYEQTVVMNLCLEGSAVIFYEYVKPVLDPENQSSYLQAHNEVDLEHEKMGIHLLENLSANQYRRLIDIQKEAWAMLEALMQRLGELTIEG